MNCVVVFFPSCFEFAYGAKQNSLFKQTHDGLPQQCVLKAIKFSLSFEKLLEMELGQRASLPQDHREP